MPTTMSAPATGSEELRARLEQIKTEAEELEKQLATAKRPEPPSHPVITIETEDGPQIVPLRELPKLVAAAREAAMPALTAADPRDQLQSRLHRLQAEATVIDRKLNPEREDLARRLNRQARRLRDRLEHWRPLMEEAERLLELEARLPALKRADATDQEIGEFIKSSGRQVRRAEWDEGLAASMTVPGLAEQAKRRARAGRLALVRSMAKWVADEVRRLQRRSSLHQRAREESGKAAAEVAAINAPLRKLGG